MLLPIVQVGDPVLRRKTRIVLADEIPKMTPLFEAMRDTMRDAPGVGLAAPQIGQSLRVTVIEDPAELHSRLTPEEQVARERAAVPFHVLVNPRLTVTDPTPVTFFEGCLSLTGFSALVTRAHGVHVEALNEHGQAVAIDATGWYARILQHEIDHLDGTLYIDRMISRSFSDGENQARFIAGRDIAEVRREFGVRG